MISKIKVITNNHWREHIYGFQLPDDVRKEFDYLEDIEEKLFIHYKGKYYLDEFMRIDDVMTLYSPEFKGWHGYMPDSFFSGLLIRYSKDCEQYQIATYFS